jgi:hypothetical protein
MRISRASSLKKPRHFFLSDKITAIPFRIMRIRKIKQAIKGLNQAVEREAVCANLIGIDEVKTEG